MDKETWAEFSDIVSKVRTHDDKKSAIQWAIAHGSSEKEARMIYSHLRLSQRGLDMDVLKV